jgi:YfiH family protein
MMNAFAPHVFTSRDVRLVEDAGEWASVADLMGVRPDRLRLIKQVHGADVAIARAGDTASWERPEADIIISDDPTVAIGVRVADCAPILIADRTRGVVAAAHAGWRGTVQSVARRAVDALRETFGSRPQDLVAAIGPCLGQCCGEVGPEVIEEFRRAGHSRRSLDTWFAPGRGDRLLLDLPGANVDQLIAAGIPLERISSANVCTKTYASLLHSYRADGNAAGRMAGMIRARG